MRCCFAGEATAGTKIFAGSAELHRRIRHRGAVVAAGGRDDAGGRRLSQQQIGEGAARLERAGVLEELELQRERDRADAELVAADRDHRRPPDVRLDQRVRGRDRVAIERRGAGGRHAQGSGQRTIPRAATGHVASTFPPRTP